MAFDFGHETSEPVFSNPFESFYDLVGLSLRSIDEAYKTMVKLKYAVVAKVRNQISINY